MDERPPKWDLAREILRFWFGPGASDRIPSEKQELWWGKDFENDRLVEERYRYVLEEAAREELSPWEETPKSCLALILVLDQFSRTIYRGDRRAFSQDGLALDVCARGIEHGMDFSLSGPERLFFYMPMMHSEDLSIQERSLVTFQKLAEEVDEAHRGDYEGVVRIAERHLAIARRFRRFPHRNEILGRTSTPEEIAFLKEAGSSF